MTISDSDSPDVIWESAEPPKRYRPIRPQEAQDLKISTQVVSDSAEVVPDSQPLSPNPSSKSGGLLLPDCSPDEDDSDVVPDSQPSQSNSPKKSVTRRACRFWFAKPTTAAFSSTSTEVLAVNRTQKERDLPSAEHVFVSQRPIPNPRRRLDFSASTNSRSQEVITISSDEDQDVQVIEPRKSIPPSVKDSEATDDERGITQLPRFWRFSGGSRQWEVDQSRPDSSFNESNDFLDVTEPFTRPAQSDENVLDETLPPSYPMLRAKTSQLTSPGSDLPPTPPPKNWLLPTVISDVVRTSSVESTLEVTQPLLFFSKKMNNVMKREHAPQKSKADPLSSMGTSSAKSTMRSTHTSSWLAKKVREKGEFSKKGMEVRVNKKKKEDDEVIEVIARVREPLLFREKTPPLKRAGRCKRKKPKKDSEEEKPSTAHGFFFSPGDDDSIGTPFKPWAKVTARREKFLKEEAERKRLLNAEPERDPGDTRSKAARKLMHGYACKCCSEYYEALGLTEEERRERIQQVSKHRTEYQVTPPTTPPHYWDVGFPTEEEQVERGLIKIKVIHDPDCK